MYHGSWRLTSLVLRDFFKDGPRTRHGILSIVIPYMILWEWQLLPLLP